MNHYPVFDGVKPSFCSKAGDTADANAPVTCPMCRERVSRMVTDRSRRAKTFRGGLMEHVYATEATQFQAVLTR